MSRDHHSPPGTPYRLRESLAALPYVGKTSHILSIKAATAAFFELQKMGSRLPDNAAVHVEPLYASAAHELEPVDGLSDTFYITGTELRSLLARAILLSTAETAFEIGLSIADAKTVQKLFTERKPQPNGEKSGDASNQPPAA